MRSVPQIMAWEFLRQGRRQMVMAFLGANLFSLLFLLPLRMDGPIDSEDPALIIMQMILIQFQSILFSVAIMGAISVSSRTYTLPVSTVTIVTWKMIPAMVMIALESIVSTLAWNWLFGLNWPCWGPALVSAVLLAVILAIFWYAEKSVYFPLVFAIGVAAVGFWYKSRWGAVFRFPDQIWSTVSLGELATMLLFVSIAYFLAVSGVARNRRGEAFGTSSDLAWLEQIVNWNFRVRAGGSGQFATPQAAQFWSEWTRKGWLLPAVLVIGMMFGMVGWTLFSRDPKELMDGMIGGGVILSGLGMLGGIVIGNTGVADTNYEMGSFLATRPLSDQDLSSSILKVVSRSVLLSWSIWFTVFTVIVGLQWLSGDLKHSTAFQNLQWWYLPATLLAAWITNATVATLSLTGQNSMWVRVITAVFALYIGVVLLAKHQGHATQQWSLVVMMVLTGLALAAFTIFLIVIALRRSAMSPQMAWVSAVMWCLTSSVIAVETVRLHWPFSAAALLIGVASLAISPFAAAPLAVAWNRHR